MSDSDDGFLDEVSGAAPRADNLPLDGPEPEADDVTPGPAAPPPRPAPAYQPRDLSKKTKGELWGEIKPRWDANPNHELFRGLKQRDVFRRKRADLATFLAQLDRERVGAHAADAPPARADEPDARGPAPADALDFVVRGDSGPKELSPAILDKLAEKMAEFNLLSVHTIESVSKAWQPGGYVLDGSTEKLAQPQVNAAMKEIMREIALDCAPDDPLLQTVSSPWLKYCLIMGTVIGTSAKKVTDLPPEPALPL